MHPVRLLVVLGGLLLSAAILWASLASNFWAAFALITAEPWGVVSLIDLYLGFVIASVIIALVERSWRAALWIVPIYVLGNVVTALWLVLNFERIRAMLRPA